jgi:hypothetical protein
MTFNYSICHPDKENIEYPPETFEEKQVLEFAKNYPWKEQLQLSKELSGEKVFYSPSLDFRNIVVKSSFGLTADYENEKISFSLWYNRPKKVKILFGLLGQSEKMVVDDVGTFTFDEAIKYLEHYVNGNYAILEELYRR